MRPMRLAVLAVAFAAFALVRTASAVEITFYYPVAVSGPLTTLIESMVADFEKSNPDITVNPVYSCNYA